MALGLHRLEQLAARHIQQVSANRRKRTGADRLRNVLSTDRSLNRMRETLQAAQDELGSHDTGSAHAEVRLRAILERDRKLVRYTDIDTSGDTGEATPEPTDVATGPSLAAEPASVKAPVAAKDAPTCRELIESGALTSSARGALNSQEPSLDDALTALAEGVDDVLSALEGTRIEAAVSDEWNRDAALNSHQPSRDDGLIACGLSTDEPFATLQVSPGQSEALPEAERLSEDVPAGEVDAAPASIEALPTDLTPAEPCEASPCPVKARSAASKAAATADTEDGNDPIRTQTMARLLARQGYRKRALSIYAELMAHDPGNEALRLEAQALSGDN